MSPQLSSVIADIETVDGERPARVWCYTNEHGDAVWKYRVSDWPPVTIYEDENTQGLFLVMGYNQYGWWVFNSYDLPEKTATRLRHLMAEWQADHINGRSPSG